MAEVNKRERYNEIQKIKKLIVDGKKDDALKALNNLSLDYVDDKDIIEIDTEKLNKLFEKNMNLSREETERKIKEFEEKDKLKEPLKFSFLRSNFDIYMNNPDRIKRMEEFKNPGINKPIANVSNDPHDLRPDFMKAQLQNKTETNNTPNIKPEETKKEEALNTPPLITPLNV